VRAARDARRGGAADSVRFASPRPPLPGAGTAAARGAPTGPVSSSPAHPGAGMRLGGPRRPNVFVISAARAAGSRAPTAPEPRSRSEGAAAPRRPIPAGRSPPPGGGRENRKKKKKRKKKKRKERKKKRKKKRKERKKKKKKKKEKKKKNTTKPNNK